MPSSETLVRLRELRLRLRELDAALRVRRNEVNAARAAVRLLEEERRSVAVEVRTVKDAITHDVMACVERGLRPGDIGRELGLPPAVVSRTIEQAKASARKRS